MSEHRASESLTAARVWKFPVPVPNAYGRAFVDVPVGTTLLSAGIQDDVMVVWGIVPDEDEREEMRRLIVANTGAVVPGFPPLARFLGTVTHENGIVWHVWDGDAT